MISVQRRNARLRPCARPKPSFAETRLDPKRAAPFGIETHQKDDGARHRMDRMGTENWAEERERLMRLLGAIESGRITHVDEEHLRQLQPTNPRNIAALRERLAELNSRLGQDGEN